MAMLRITFDVDTSKCFDTLHKMNGDSSHIGARIIGAMMTGKASLSDEIGMAIYGIEIVNADPRP